MEKQKKWKKQSLFILITVGDISIIIIYTFWYKGVDIMSLSVR